MTNADVNQFAEEKECAYQGERYSVRDNGSILRHARDGKRARAADNEWTFGKESSSHPYLEIAGVRVHRLVALAFHGEPDDPNYVVDHIDTNCRNNRPENLRWLSRLENVLKNPMTRRRVEYVCGSIEAFLANPSLLRESRVDPNFTWMRAVSTEEARNCRARIALWAGTAGPPAPLERTQKSPPKNLDRIHRRLQKWEAGLSGEPGLDFALTPRSAQYMWNGAIYFPCCPIDVGEAPLDDYERHLQIGCILAYSDDMEICPALRVQRVEYLRKRNAILVLCSHLGPSWAIVGIEVSRKEIPHFIHFNLGVYQVETEATDAFSEKETADFWSDAYKSAWKNR
ncbi:MAG: HNH endonuclease [Bradyrhizobium sp.]|uniref:HNH endonuclease signature motif containing protein n=1 Tax=Bradyrhizobium sp. TaxID=376 RepID=UPI003D0BBD1B